MKTFRASLLALALGSSLVLTACGGSDEPKKAEATASPSTDVTVPSGVSLTDYGTVLQFGQKATVPYEPNDQRSSVLEITVDDVQQASIGELGAYVLDAETKKSTPYYVHLTLTNVGQGDLGRTGVPVFLVDSANTLINSSSFTNTFEPCESAPLPESFAPAQTVKTCQLYLVPEGRTYAEMSFRPIQDVEPIIWEGDATTSKALTAEQAKKNKKAEN